jgi:hypothetical protein
MFQKFKTKLTSTVMNLKIYKIYKKNKNFLHWIGKINIIKYLEIFHKHKIKIYFFNNKIDLIFIYIYSIVYFINSPQIIK